MKPIALRTIGPRAEIKTFHRRVRALLAHPEIYQAVLVVKRRGPKFAPRVLVMDLDGRVSETIGMLEWAKLNIFDERMRVE